MRSYEFMYIVNPDLEQEALEQLTSRIEQLIDDAGGEVLRLRSWGRRRLAYPIAGFREGHYHVAYLQLEPGAIADVRGRLALTEEVIRYFLIKADKVPEEVTEEVPGEEPAVPEEESEEEAEADWDEEEETEEEESGD